METVIDTPKVIDNQYHSYGRSGKSFRGSVAFSTIRLQSLTAAIGGAAVAIESSGSVLRRPAPAVVSPKFALVHSRSATKDSGIFLLHATVLSVLPGCTILRLAQSTTFSRKEKPNDSLEMHNTCWPA